MAKIKQLPPHEAQKIAAGEVVERPANIVKELVENSIDAGATRITLFIEDAGKQLIRIVDNGCGMDSTDAQLCFDRHATSKITHVDELESINTFGFRGEALASIASVSVITLTTKEEHTVEGTKVVVNANKIIEKSSVACATGTDISIQDLFFNVPARKKFLKTTQTEWRAIQLLFNAFCFDYPHIHFVLFSDGKQVFNCPASSFAKASEDKSSDLRNRALQLWESQTLLRSPSYEGQANSHLLTLQTTEKDFSIFGIMSDHQYYRYDRSSIYFFVNKRWIKNQHLSNAFIKGYTNVLPAGRYPVAIIHLTVPATEVDINIHPRKEEVKFLHPRRIEQALQQMVKSTLEKNLSQQLKKEVTFQAAPTQYSPQSHNFKPFDFDTFLKQNNSAPLPLRQGFVAQVDTSSFVKTLEDTQSERWKINQFNPNLQQKELTIEHAINNTPSPFVLSLSNHTNTESYRLIGQYNSTYILVEKEDGLFLVDQHAAHERILYELFSQRFEEVATIQLLFPHIITLSSHDITTISPHLDIFTNNGIIIEQCASDQLRIESLPVHLKDQSLDDMIQETISWIAESSTLDTHALKKLLNNKLQAQMACKAAVKAGDILTQEKMEQLLRDLEKTANRFSCPHGRPTGWLLSLHEIEKKFKRRI